MIKANIVKVKVLKGNRPFLSYSRISPFSVLGHFSFMPELPSFQVNLYDQNVLKSKKRRKRASTRKPSFRPAYIPELRIIKRDIRRRYSEIMLNVVNSHDVHFLKSYFEMFTSPIVECFDEDAPQSIYDHYRWPKYSRGYQRILEAMTMSYQLFPDAVYYLEDIRISVAMYEHGSRLSAKLKCKRTQVFDAQFLTTGDEFNDNEKHPAYELVQLETPVINELEGHFTMWLDEYHRIERVRLTFDRFSLTPMTSN